MISYAPLWKTLSEKNITQYELIHRYGVSTGTLDAIRKNRHISTRTINRLCAALDCHVEDIILYSRDSSSP